MAPHALAVRHPLRVPKRKGPAPVAVVGADRVEVLTSIVMWCCHGPCPWCVMGAAMGSGLPAEAQEGLLSVDILAKGGDREGPCVVLDPT